MVEHAVQLTRNVELEEVQWSKVLEVLCKRFRLSSPDADRAIRDFVKRCMCTFNAYWFLHPVLTAKDNMIATALSDLHAADTVVLTSFRAHGDGPLRVSCYQELAFTPNLRSASPKGSRCDAHMELLLFGRRIPVGSARKVALVQATLGLFGLTLFALLGGLLLYSIAVFAVFLESPVHVTRRATTDASIGLALLSFLVGAAGICGRAVSNLTDLTYRALFEKHEN
jgi:hypothetical protein